MLHSTFLLKGPRVKAQRGLEAARLRLTFKGFLSDVISIEKTSEHFRLVYDTKGRFAVHRITSEEAKVRPVMLNEASSYRVPLFVGALLLLLLRLCRWLAVSLGKEPPAPPTQTEGVAVSGKEMPLLVLCVPAFWKLLSMNCGLAS